MTSPAAGGPTVRRTLPATGWGGKAILVCVLALLMAIPGLFIFGLVTERSHRAQSVIDEVSALRGGRQQLLGPLFVAPYDLTNDKGEVTSHGWYVVSPIQGSAKIDVKTSSLHRGLFQVPVYDASAEIHAAFAPLAKAAAQSTLGPSARIDWDRGAFVIGFSDLRGARSDVVASFVGPAGKSALSFAPASMGLGAPSSPQSDNATQQATDSDASFGLIAAPGAAIASSQTGGAFEAVLRFTGAQRLSVLPFAKSTHVVIVGDWPAPSFDGAFLPDSRQLTKAGFTAAWEVPFLARGLAAEGGLGALSLSKLGERDVGLTFALANNPYENVTRSLKYGVMFVGLVFLTFFVFEALSGKRLHPAQYVLIGLVQMIFYLLLLSLSEYVGFDAGFSLGGVATVGLISLYASWAFKDRKQGLRALAVFGPLYVLIYCLMRLEDFALLAGSVASFIGLAAAMYLTRNIEWYGGQSDPAEPRAP